MDLLIELSKSSERVIRTVFPSMRRAALMPRMLSPLNLPSIHCLLQDTLASPLLPEKLLEFFYDSNALCWYASCQRPERLACIGAPHGVVARGVLT